MTPARLLHLAALAALPLACATEALEVDPVGPTGVGGAGGAGGAAVSSTVATGGEGGGVAPQSCAPGTFVTGLDGSGTLTCGAVEAHVPAAAARSCAIYLGWTDSCGGCTSNPHKWGYASGETCVNGAGAANTCTVPELTLGEGGGEPVVLYGLNTDGDVNNDDKFSMALRCRRDGESAVPGPCEPGELASGIGDGFVECVSVDQLVSQYVHQGCALYLGWRDGCGGGCTEPPSKWGWSKGVDCLNGAGADNSCYTPFIGQEWVPWFGLDTDGDVDNNDKFFVGLDCQAPAESPEQTAFGGCPAGMLVTGIREDGSLTCRSAIGEVISAVRGDCSVYFGWRDSCNACEDPPAKWGRVGAEGCEVTGADSTCTEADLGGVPLHLLGINTDGDVNGDDKFYVGWHCASAPVDPPDPPQ